MDELTKTLNCLCDDVPFDTWWYVKDLRTGDVIERNAREVVPSASTRKINILMAALKKVNDGHFNLDDPFVLEEKYQGNTSGCFQHFRPGFQITFYDALLMMIIMSDNTCTGKIFDMCGIDYLNDYTKSIGMVGTTHRPRVEPETLPLNHPVEANNATTAADVGHLLELIINGTEDRDTAATLGVTPELCTLAIDILKKQRLTQKLPALLPPEATVAHKTGTGRRMANDAGIIFKNDEPVYIMTVYISGAPREQRDGPDGQTAAKAHAARLCRAVWDALVA
jgi:beta-lactamase class A